MDRLLTGLSTALFAMCAAALTTTICMLAFLCFKLIIMLVPIVSG